MKALRLVGETDQSLSCLGTRLNICGEAWSYQHDLLTAKSIIEGLQPPRLMLSLYWY